MKDRGATVKEEYTLYLDETKFRHDGDHVFTVAGVIVNTNDEIALDKAMVKLKKDIWRVPRSKNYILHEAEIRNCTRSSREDYDVFRAVSVQQTAFQGIGKILNDLDLKVLGAIVNTTSISKAYNIDLEKNNDAAYKICLKEIVQNFVMFLKLHDAKGHIVLESRQSGNSIVEDQRVRKHVTKIMANGTNLYSGPQIQESLLDVDFLGKKNNSSGLQVADFIPRPLVLNYCKVPQSHPSIYKKFIRKQRFDGYQKTGSTRFGVKIVD